MSRLLTICRCCLRDGVPRRSFAVAAVVGTILNLINQGDALFGTHPLNLSKLLVTYLVPYCVAPYGAVSYQLALGRAVKPPATGRSGKRHSASKPPITVCCWLSRAQSTGGEPGTVVRRREVERGAQRQYAPRVEVAHAAVIAEFDLGEVDGRSYPRHLVDFT